MRYPRFEELIALDAKSKFFVKWACLDLGIQHGAFETVFSRVRQCPDHELSADSVMTVFGSDGDPFQLYFPVVYRTGAGSAKPSSVDQCKIVPAPIVEAIEFDVAAHVLFAAKHVDTDREACFSILRG